MTYEIALEFALTLLIYVGSITFALFLLITILYVPSFFQAKVNLRKSEEILQHNIEVIEKATFFETNQEFNKTIEEQMNTIRGNAAKIKSLNAQIDALEQETTRKKTEKK